MTAFTEKVSSVKTPCLVYSNILQLQMWTVYLVAIVVYCLLAVFVCYLLDVIVSYHCLLAVIVY